MNIKRLILFLLSIIITGCGIYTFSGSTLPSHLETIDIPLFSNNSDEPGVAESITEMLNTKVINEKLLNPVVSGSDATISGRVLHYSDRPYDYSSDELRKADVESYEVTIVVEVQFVDNVKDKILYSGEIRETGVYDFKNESEDIGREKAMKKIVDQIFQNSLQSW